MSSSSFVIAMNERRQASTSSFLKRVWQGVPLYFLHLHGIHGASGVWSSGTSGCYVSKMDRSSSSSLGPDKIKMEQNKSGFCLEKDSLKYKH